jgi:hypothetical protein
MFYFRFAFGVEKKSLGGLLAFGCGDFEVVNNFGLKVLVRLNLEIDATDDAAVLAFFVGKAFGHGCAFKEFSFNLAVRIAKYCCFHILILPHAVSNSGFAEGSLRYFLVISFKNR